MINSQHVYEVRPRKDKRGVDLLSDVLRTLRRIAPQALPGQRDAWEADRLERYKGNPPKMLPMVVDPAAGGEASHASADAWNFFTGKERAGGRQVAV